MTPTRCRTAVGPDPAARCSRQASAGRPWPRPSRPRTSRRRTARARRSTPAPPRVRFWAAWTSSLVASSGRSASFSITSSQPLRASSGMPSGVPASRSFVGGVLGDRHRVLVGDVLPLVDHVGVHVHERLAELLHRRVRRGVGSVVATALPAVVATAGEQADHEHAGRRAGRCASFAVPRSRGRECPVSACAHTLPHGDPGASAWANVTGPRGPSAERPGYDGRDGRRAACRGTPGAAPAPRPSEARWGVCHWTSRSRGSSGSSRRRSTSATSATFEASVSRWNIDSPANSPPIETPYSAAGEPAVAPGLHRVHPAEPVQLDVRRPDRRVDPACGPAGVGAGVDHLGQRGVDADLEPAHRPPQRPRHPQAVQRQHAASYRREPQHRVAAPPRRHREQPPPVGLQQRPRRQVGPRRDQVVVRVEPRRPREPPVAPRRLDAHGDDGRRSG